jgi:DNA-binding IclR family transcriptional regulator
MRTLKQRNPDGDSVQSVERAFALLRIVADERVPCSAPELARRAAMSKPAVYRLLRAMERSKAVVRDAASGRYSIGVALRELAANDGWFLPLRRAALPQMHRLRALAGETVVLYASQNELETVCLEVLTSEHSIRMNDRIGARFPIGRGAGGMILLADLARREGIGAVTTLLERFDAQQLPVGGVPTVLERIARTRDVHVSTLGERIAGAAAIAAAIRLSDDGPVLAILAACGPADRFTPAAIAAWTPHVRDAALRIGTSLR